MINENMKATYLIVLLISCIYSNAQDTVFKYYDKNWNPVPVQNGAKFYGIFVKNGSVYDCKTFYLPSMKKRGISTQKDTTFNNPAGLVVMYHLNGRISDSSFVNTDGKAEYVYRYYPGGQLKMQLTREPGKGNPLVTGYNEDGSKIKNFILAREAEFDGGEKGWHKYLVKNMNRELSTPRTKNTTEVQAKVMVQFVVNEQGNVANVKIIESSGYKFVDNDAVRVIANSPKWENAILFNEPVIAYRKQPLTYILIIDK